MKTLLAFFLLCSLMSPRLSAAPRIACADAEFNFGRVMGEPVISHRFQIENTGEKTLHIRRIQTSCGCTTAGVRSLKIRPGESEELPVEMNLKGRSGEQTQYITLHSNDPDTPQLTLKVFGTAVPPIEIEPRTLNLKRIPAENLAAGAGDIVLTSQTGDPFTVEEVDILNGRVTTEVHYTEDGRTATITVTPLPQKGDGHFTDVLNIRTSRPDMAPKRVLVMWQISRGVSVSPGVLNLRLLPQNPVQQRYLMVQGFPGLAEPLAVTDVTWDGLENPITWNTLPQGIRIHIRDLVVTPEMDGTTLRIQTNAPGFEELAVPVRVNAP